MTGKEIVYIAGPITNDPDYERKFNQVEKKLREMGYRPINPIAGNEKRRGWTYKQYIDRGLRLLMTSDAICITDVWVDSKGLDAETAYVDAVGLPKMYAIEIEPGIWDIE